MTKNQFLSTPDAVSDSKIGLFVFMVSLNLPPFGYTLKKESGRVFILDIIRKKYLVLTPEEWYDNILFII